MAKDYYKENKEARLIYQAEYEKTNRVAVSAKRKLKYQRMAEALKLIEACGLSEVLDKIMKERKMNENESN